MDTQTGFSPKSFVLARLLVQPIYREDGSIWDTLRAERESIIHYFRQIGQDVVIDEAEGYAFLRQIEAEGGETLPRVGRRQSLGYTATVLLVCLREELARFDAAPGDSTRLVLARQQLRELVHQFRRETNDQTRDVRAIDGAIKRLEELSFLRPFGPVEADTFEVMRILKARFGASELQEVKERLARHVEAGA
jgi:phosphoglycolate phosphatase-like HAD superfamily hydrolase